MVVATIARRKEYGILKAMGVQNRRLYQIVALQSLLSVGMGLVAAVSLTLLLSVLIPRVNELLVLALTLETVIRLSTISVALAAAAAILPARQLQASSRSPLSGRDESRRTQECR